MRHISHVGRAAKPDIRAGVPTSAWSKGRRRQPLLALLAASFLGSCDTAPPQLGPGSGFTFPDCTDGQIIGFDDNGMMVCSTVPRFTIDPPACQPGTQALTSEMDPVTYVATIRCIDLGAGANDPTTESRIVNAQSAAHKLQMALSQLAGSRRARYVGLSTTKGNGRITSGTASGLGAARLLCEGQYGSGAHMCTPFEIYQTAAAATAGQLLDGTADDGPGLVYMQADSNGYNGIFGPQAATDDPGAGQDDNCGAYLSPVDTPKWRATLFTFSKNVYGVRVPKFDSNISCNPGASGYALACCK